MTTQQSTTYNETEIVRLVSDIYTILIRQGHLEEDEVIWAPEGGHVLDLAKIYEVDANARIDTRVVSLMEHLPIPNFDYKPIAPGMTPVAYTNSRTLVPSRDIDKLEYWQPPDESRLDVTNALPTELLLLDGQESTDPCLVLDIADNTIRYFHPSWPDEQLSAAIDQDDHRNWPATDAVEYLRNIHSNYLEAKWITNGISIFEIHEQEVWWRVWFWPLKRSLIEDHGWPDTFRREDWKRNGNDLVGRLMDQWSEENTARVAAHVAANGGGYELPS